MQWDRDSAQKDEARDRLKIAMANQFNDIYGTNVQSLTSWQKLCQVIEIDPIPESLGACRQLVLQTHVNLVDLIDSPTTGNSPALFDSEEQLSEYTKRTGKYFPKESAYAGGVLRFLLRRIENPGISRRRGTSEGRKGRDRSGRGGRGGRSRGRGRGRNSA